MNFILGSQYKAFILAQFTGQSHCIMQFLSVQSMQQVASKWQALAQHLEVNIKHTSLPVPASYSSCSKIQKKSVSAKPSNDS